MSTNQDERATLTLTIEGGSFNDMDLGRTGQIFGLLGSIAGKGSTLTHYGTHTIVVQEGYSGSASEINDEEEPYKEGNDA
ncbi:hypothetical protein L0636_01245 [Halomonas janggokensis]|uniref:Uncharacterized protein n=1 Tax=Vreelandella janggokensis TaxID=370767 RepID=A0ABT4ITG3_9GAMM|nr:hypothetical protein [Halomonas janggokensis]MCZ0926513.1 hypothetical protein [Halomonas janggokensis]MCZ0929051.1 hypothetical protein [Halomonas janggokensis]